MSDEQQTVETPVEPETEVAVSEPTPEEPADGQEETPEDEDGPLAKQAAKWRKRARELEGELAQANEVISGLRRQQAEALAATEGVRPAALWAVTSLDNLLEDGVVDPGKVRAAVEQTVQELGVQPKRALDIPGEGRATTPAVGGGRAKWDAAFKPTYQR